MKPGESAVGQGPGWRTFGHELETARSVDDVATVALRRLTEQAGVNRAGLALTVPGGRQLRFVSSDPEALAGPVQWCLIDAYDTLPLNDAVRTGTDVVLANRRSLDARYPTLASRQGARTRSVVALALDDGERRIGGLLLYLDAELDPPEVGPLLSDVKAGLARALRAAQDVGGAGDPGDLLPPGHRLPPDETAPSLARRFLRRTLGDWGVTDDVVDSALLCASEVVTNVVMHAARPSVIVAERTGDAVTVRVWHPTVASAPPTGVVDDPDPMGIAGRGLALVDAVAAGWGVDHEADLTCWWFGVA